MCVSDGKSEKKRESEREREREREIITHFQYKTQI